jgi:hypothetical protein
MINVIDNDGCHRHGSPSVYLGSIIAHGLCGGMSTDFSHVKLPWAPKW